MNEIYLGRYEDNDGGVVKVFLTNENDYRIFPGTTITKKIFDERYVKIQERESKVYCKNCKYNSLIFNIFCNYGIPLCELEKYCIFKKLKYISKYVDYKFERKYFFDKVLQNCDGNCKHYKPRLMKRILNLFFKG